MRLPLAAGLALAIGVGAPQQPPPPRDLPATAAGTAVVRGRVTAAATGQPLHRVRVTLNTSNPNPPTTVTDTRGMFELTNVPSGKYTDTPWDVPTGGRQIDVLKIVLTQKAGRISGSVAASDGKPTAAATVLVFADDDKLWMPGSRFVRSARPDRDGRFAVSSCSRGSSRSRTRSDRRGGG